MALTRPKAAQVNFDVTNVTDPLIRLNSGQTGANDKDSGIVIERGSDTNVAIIWDESADQLAIVNTAEDGSTSGNVTISSYANIRANAFYGDGSNLTGVSGYSDTDVATYLSNNGYGTSTSIIASITDSAPSTLDTLNELAAALGDDANFSTTVTNSLATKAPLASPALTGIATVAGTVEISPGTSYDPTGGGTGTDTASDVAVAFPSGNRIVGTNDGYIRTIIEWNSGSNIQIGQGGTSLINGIDLLPGSSGSAKVNGSRILTTADEGTGNGLDADTVDGLHETSFVRTSSGTSSTLDTLYRAGMFGWNTSTTGKPGDSYGQGLAIVSPGSTHNDTNNWITQLGFGTNRNSAYFRGKTNDGDWGSWNTFWHSGNDGSGSGLDADTVDGIQASSFLRSDANDTKTGNIVLQAAADVSNSTTGLFFETGGGYTDGRYRTRFRKQDVGGGIPLYIDQSSGTANSYTAQARFGTYSGNSYEFEVFGDIKANGNVDATGVFNGTATSAQYADLAEKYLADAAYPIGTVLEIGGDAEVTIASPDSYKIVGTVSEAPGLLMNSGLEGEHVVPVAYIGRVPCRVQGTINRGDFLVVGNTPGVAVAEHPMNILMGAAIGKALENYNSNDEGIIEILVGRL